MADQDLYQLTDVHYNNNQLMQNVYFYKRDSIVVSATDAEALANNWTANFLPAVLAIHNTTVLHTEIRVKNLYDPSDAFTKLINSAGGVANTDEGSTFLAVNFTLGHDNPAIRKGRKAYGGLTEGDMLHGSVQPGGFVTALDTLADEQSTPLQEGIVDTWFPMIVKRILTAGVYGLPTTPEEAILGLVTDAIFNTLITTQNSRKEGHGD